MSTTSNKSAGGKPVYVYFNLPHGLYGRGGVLELFMRVHGIEFEVQRCSDADWPAMKRQLIESGENPCGTLPILRIGGKVLSQHVSIMKYLAIVRGIAPKDAAAQFAQDAMADEYHTWRARWFKALTGAAPAKVEYKQTSLPEMLRMFEAMFKNGKGPHGGPYMSPGKPLWGDTALFALLLDHVVAGMMDVSQLNDYPCLKGLFKAFSEEPSAYVVLPSGKAHGSS
eukprot:jgi/Mesvir1/6666/Mv12428-RA.1